MKTKPITIEPNSGTKYAGRKVRVEPDNSKKIFEIAYVGKDGFIDSAGNHWYLQREDWQFEEVIEPTRWRANEKENYYWFDDVFEIIHEENDVGADADEFNYKVGNYFKTKAQCEEAITRVKKVLLEYQEELMRERE